jgi:putative ABC transport system substrate-binding protein
MRLGRFTVPVILALALIAVPLAAEAQQVGKVPRIGYLEIASAELPIAQAMIDAFRQGLRERGYVEGQTFVIEYRAAAGRVERLSDLAEVPP